MPKRTLRFLQYSIHAHLEVGNPDYAALFKAMTILGGKYRQNGKRVTAIGAAMLTKGSNDQERLSLIVYTGDNDQNILFFDLNQQAEFNAATVPGRFVARKTHVLIDPEKRTLMLESGRNHPPAEELAEFIEDEARHLVGFETLELSFTPVPTPSFAQKITGMRRIQSATVSLARPNVDWGDRYTQLTGIATDSNAKAIDATVRAGRNETLSKQSGLIPNLVTWLTGALPAVLNAKIKGKVDDDSPLTELKLSDYIEAITIPVEVNPETKQALDSKIQRSLNSYFDSRDKENG
jgi:hypothetical protein